MRILIVAATEMEIEPLLRQAPEIGPDILITGAGMVATAYHLGKKLRTVPPYDLILNVGITGTFDRTMALGTVVNVVEDTFSELGAEDGENWLSIEELGLGTGSYSSLSPVSDESIALLPVCRGITVNTVHGHLPSISRIQARLPQVQVESMEGAAVFYAAAQENIPVLQIRALSNYVEKRNRQAWNIPLAIENLNAWLADFIRSNIK